MKKIGLMGCGTVADYGHLPAIKSVPEWELFAIFDPVQERLRKAQTTFNVPHAFDNEEAFFSSGIEAVTITSPAPFHKNNVLAAARHRLPVLCEKPLATNREDAGAMVEAMARAGVPLYTAFCYRFSPSALKIRDLVASGAIGTVRTLRLIFNWGLHGKFQSGPGGERILNARRVARMEEGGPMLDCGTHQIDLATFWLQSPVVRVNGHGSWIENFEAPDHVWAHLDHANGAHTVVEMSCSTGHTTKNLNREFIYELIGTDGVIRYDSIAHVFGMETAEGRQDFAFHPEKEFAGMYREFAKALETGKSNLLPTAKEGMTVVDIAQQATDQAIASRQPKAA